MTRKEWIEETCRYAGLTTIPDEVRMRLEWQPEPVLPPLAMARIVREFLSTATQA